MKNPFTKEFHPNKGKPVKIKPAFRIGLTQYYELDNILDMPVDRSILYQQLFREFEMRVDKDYLIEFCDTITKCHNANDFSKAVLLNQELKARTEALIERETMYRLFAILYFPIKEDISLANYDLVQSKADYFKKKGSKFILSTPFRAFLPQAITTPTGLDTYLKAAGVGLAANLAILTNWNNKTGSTGTKRKS